nr:hypothetical protein [Bacilli bacterium]
MTGLLALLFAAQAAAFRTFGVYLFAWQLHFGLPAVWVCIGLDNALRTLLYARYRKQKKNRDGQFFNPT